MYEAGKRAADGSAYGMADPKRARTAEAGVSKVLHVRGLPPFTTEAELVALAYPFGKVEKCLILAEKHQAFVQMDNADAAAKLLATYESQAAVIRAKPVYFQYSSRQEVQVRDMPKMDAFGNSLAALGGLAGLGGAVGAGNGEDPCAILLVTVLNVTVPVTLDNIHQIFKPYGDVLKIITFTKQDLSFQALVQMATVESAINAKLFLEGKDMFHGCCHLRINFSKRQNLVVRENGPKSFDFTQSNPGLGAPYGLSQYGMMGSMPGLPPMPPMSGMPPPPPGPMGGGGSPVVLVNRLDTERTTPDILFSLFGVYGDVLRVKILYQKRDTAMIQFSSPQQAQLASMHLNHCPLFGQELVVTPSKHPEVKLPKEGGPEGDDLTRDYANSPLHRYKKRGGQSMNPKNPNPPSQVLYVANIYDGCLEAEVRDFFAPHNGGKPPAVEFFKTSRKMAYVAMRDVPTAVAALIALHNTNLGQYPIRIAFSHKDASGVNNSDNAPVV